MGHNVDLGFFGMCNIRCKKCDKELDISEVDIDCDVKTHHPMTFELNLQCFECGHEDNNFIFTIIDESDEQ